MPRGRRGDPRGDVSKGAVLIPGYGFSFHVHRNAQYVSGRKIGERGNGSGQVRSVRTAVRRAAEMGRVRMQVRAEIVRDGLFREKGVADARGRSVAEPEVERRRSAIVSVDLRFEIPLSLSHADVREHGVFSGYEIARHVRGRGSGRSIREFRQRSDARRRRNGASDDRSVKKRSGRTRRRRVLYETGNRS